MPLTIIHWLALVGFILSMYFLYVGRKLSSTKNYRALCDITETISCSKAAKSKYSSLAVIPNALYGVIFYFLVFVLFPSYNQFVFYLAVMASLISLYLVIISFKMKVICPVCISTYIINFLILYFSYLALV